MCSHWRPILCEPIMASWVLPDRSKAVVVLLNGSQAMQNVPIDRNLARARAKTRPALGIPSVRSLRWRPRCGQHAELVFRRGSFSSQRILRRRHVLDVLKRVAETFPCANGAVDELVLVPGESAHFW